MYTVFEEQIENEATGEYSDELKNLLDSRYEACKKEGISISGREADKRIKKLLKSIEKQWMYKVIYSPAAIEDYEKSILWYAV